MNPNAVSVTVVLIANNQEKNLEPMVRELQRIVPRYFMMWEFLIFDDGSRDRTGPIAERLALYDENIRVFHHDKTEGPGACHREALREAGFEHFVQLTVTADFDLGPLRQILEAAGRADIILPHALNPGNLSLADRMLALLLVGVVNGLSGRRLRGCDGPILFQTLQAKACPPTMDGFGYQAEVLIKLFKQGYAFHEVGVELAPQTSGLSRVFRRLGDLTSRA